MEEHVCLVCLKTFESFPNASVQDDEISVPLFTKFIKFAQNYLHISSPVMSMIIHSSGASESDPDVFCEKCELVLITPICQVYLEFLSAQLRLSWELEQLGKLLENSQQFSMEYKLKDTSMKTLTEELGDGSVQQLDQFRNLLLQKCRLKRKETLPIVLVGPRCENNQPGSLWDRDDEDDNNDTESVFDPSGLDDAGDSGYPLDFQLEGDAIEFGDKNGGANRMVKIEPSLAPEDEAVEQVDVHDPEHNPENKNVACPYCESVFTSTTQLHEHIAATHLDSCVLHLDDDLHKCSKCGSSFNTRLGLTRHEAACLHVNENVNNKTAVENIMMMPSPISLDHFEDENESELEYSEDSTLDTSHFQSKAAAEANNPEETKYPCIICGKVFPTRKSCITHKSRIHNHRRYKCPLCPISFKAKCNVGQHITAVHKPQTHICAHCQRTFTTAKYLNQHIRRIHTVPNQEQFNCQKCNTVFSTRFSLNRHEAGCLHSANMEQILIKIEGTSIPFEILQQQFEDETGPP